MNTIRCLLFATCLLGSLVHAKEGTRPNVLLILVDDQSPFDLRCYDPQSALEAPNIDRLASEGMVFDAAYHMGSYSGAVCTPSRHMIMSGRTLWHLPDAPNALERQLCPEHLEQQTLPAVFNRAGYSTMRTCKQGNSYEAANKMFRIRHDATKRGATNETGSPWHADRVLEYLSERELTNESRPFLIYFGFSHPHDTRDGTPELLAKYGAVNHTDLTVPPPANTRQPKLPLNYLPEHPFPHGHPGLRDEVAVSGVWQRRDEETIRNEIGRQFACCENIDIQIGRVLSKLDAMGELENTYVIYTSDHGMAIGRHGLQGKQNLYEHTWRVPFIVKGPGIQPGSRVQGNIYLLDLLATLCDLTGIPVPETNEGTSFKPVLEGRQKSIRDVLYGAYCGGTRPGMRSVRQGDWKLIKYDVMHGEVRETQLFNLKQNPNEYLAEHQGESVKARTEHLPESHQVNLATDPKLAGKLAEMESLLLNEMRRLHDPWRLWNQPEEDIAKVTGFSAEKQSDRMLISLDGKYIAEFVFADPKILRPYFANLKLPDGKNVTRNHPPIKGQDALDHETMHPGVWLGFGDLNGHDFWRNKANVKHVRFLSEPVVKTDSLSFSTECDLQTSDGQSLGRLINRFQFKSKPLGWLLIWEASIHAGSQPIELGDQEEMGFGARVASSITEKSGGLIINSNNVQTARETWGNEAEWCDYAAILEKQTESAENRGTGIALMASPRNFRRSWWHNRDYGLMVANPFGRKAMKQGELSQIKVDAGEAMTICFGAYIHASLDSNDLASVYKEFADAITEM